MGKLIIDQETKARFPVKRVQDVQRGAICCWPRGSHLFEFVSRPSWDRRVWLRYLDDRGVPSVEQTDATNKPETSEIIVIRQAGDTTPIKQIIGDTTPTTEGNITMAKLYQTKEETPRFGTLLATNSAGLFVMEMKGTGEVLTFAKTEVEEVKPYTVRIRFQDSATEYDYLSRKGDVEKGDMIILDGNGHIAKVIAVDTKSDRATKDLVGRKVLTAPFGEQVTE